MKFRIALAISLVLSISLVACASGYPDPQQLSTLEGITMAVKEYPSTIRAIRGNVVAFGWPDANGIRFAMINFRLRAASHEIPKIIQGGLLIGAKNTDIEEILQQDGWKLITRAQIPAEVLLAVESAGSWLVYLSRGLPTFFIAPVILEPLLTPTPTKL